MTEKKTVALKGEMKVKPEVTQKAKTELPDVPAAEEQPKKKIRRKAMLITECCKTTDFKPIVRWNAGVCEQVMFCNTCGRVTKLIQSPEQ